MEKEISLVKPSRSVEVVTQIGQYLQESGGSGYGHRCCCWQPN